MKRLAVALAAVSMAAVSVVATTAAPAGAAVAGKTTVFAANAFSYAGGHPFGGTFCVNGTAISSDVSTEQVDGPLIVDSGEANVLFYDASNATCGDEPVTAQLTTELPDGGSVTLMAYWGNDGHAVVMLTNPLDCVDPGMGRLTVRNGADSKGGAVDIYGEIDGVSTLLLSDIVSGSQGTVDLPVGTYTNVYASETGTLNLVTPMDDISIVADSGAYAYTYGGNDGAPGAFTANPAELDACTVPTTVAPTTTAPPAAAAAVQATPAFTG